jgi:hypothetical protein
MQSFRMRFRNHLPMFRFTASLQTLALFMDLLALHVVSSRTVRVYSPGLNVVMHVFSCYFFPESGLPFIVMTSLGSYRVWGRYRCLRSIGFTSSASNVLHLGRMGVFKLRVLQKCNHKLTISQF